MPKGLKVVSRALGEQGSPSAFQINSVDVEVPVGVRLVACFEVGRRGAGQGQKDVLSAAGNTLFR